MHIPRYAERLRTSVSLILCTATRFSLKILLLMYVGLEDIFNSLFLSVTNLTSTRFLRFSIVFPKTELFINLKKSFSKAFLALVLF